MAQQGQALVHYLEQLMALQTTIVQLHQALVNLTGPGINLGDDKFDGSADLCKGFLQRCDFFFTSAYRNDSTGSTLDWAMGI